ncbi:MAG: hypothetical protein D6722_21390, partial [Bacteroidetes bacterium]
MLRFVSFLSLLVTIIALPAQTPRALALKLEATALLDPIIPAAELGAELPLNQRISATVALGVGGLPNLIPWVPNRRNHAGWKARAG